MLNLLHEEGEKGIQDVEEEARHGAGGAEKEGGEEKEVENDAS